jgi:protein-S-isoprenylcysteine O-methyltransferase Ste14
MLFLHTGEASPSAAWIVAGASLVALGELVRIWGVRHIGVISRTRSDRLGPLVATGPFAFVRNPLYLGNVALWAGFALIARMPWLAPIVVCTLGLEYHAIVRWEERLLASRLGDGYRDYAARVPRWLPRVHKIREAGIASGNDLGARERRASGAADGSWSETFFSERGTLIAIGVGCLLLWLKARFV